MCFDAARDRQELSALTQTEWPRWAARPISPAAARLMPAHADRALTLRPMMCRRPPSYRRAVMTCRRSAHVVQDLDADGYSTLRNVCFDAARDKQEKLQVFAATPHCVCAVPPPKTYYKRSRQIGVKLWMCARRGVCTRGRCGRMLPGEAGRI